MRLFGMVLYSLGRSHFLIKSKMLLLILCAPLTWAVFREDLSLVGPLRYLRLE